MLHHHSSEDFKIIFSCLVGIGGFSAAASVRGLQISAESKSGDCFGTETKDVAGSGSEKLDRITGPSFGPSDVDQTSVEQVGITFVEIGSKSSNSDWPELVPARDTFFSQKTKHFFFSKLDRKTGTRHDFYFVVDGSTRIQPNQTKLSNFTSDHFYFRIEPSGSLLFRHFLLCFLPTDLSPLSLSLFFSMV